MSLLKSSSRSSSSYRSSSRYSTSSSYRSEGSLGTSSDSLFEPFLDSTEHSRMFEDEDGSSCLTPLHKHSRSYGQTGGAVIDHQSGGGGVRRVGDNYCISADVSQFEAHDIVVLSYNQQVVIQAQKVFDDGSVSDTFTHTSQFPEDMDPLSVSGTLSPEGTLVVSVSRSAELDRSSVPTYRSEAFL